MAENRFKARQQQRAASEQERLEQAMGTVPVPAAKQETELLQCHISKELKGKFKAYCAMNGLNMKEVMTELVTGYLKDNGAL